MNSSSQVAENVDSSGRVLPGLEHIDLRREDEDYGATWIGDLISAIRRQGYKLILWLLFCFFSSLVYTLLASPEYIASAQIVLEPRVRIASGVDAAAAAAPILDSAQAESQLQIIRSAHNLRYVFDKLNLEKDPSFVPKGPGSIARMVGQIKSFLSYSKSGENSQDNFSSNAKDIAFLNFSDRVQTRRLGQSYVIEVSFRGSNPETTARITNSIAASYIRDQVLVHGISEQRGTEFLQGRITLIQAQRKAADEAVSSGVITDFQFPDSDARIVGAALKPLSPAYPQTKLNLLFGIVLGLVTGVAFIAVMNNFDNRVRTPAQIRRVIGIDCLVIIPRNRIGFLSISSAADKPETDFARSLRFLRTVLFAAAQTETYHASIGFVSCHEGDGCSSLAANLSRLLASPSNQVVLVDANLQNPDLTRLLSPNCSKGLEGLISSTSGEGKLPEIRLSESLSFVPAVSTDRAADPNSFLGTPAMRMALKHLNDRRSCVVDLPSLDVSSDAQAIGSMLSGVVLVAAINRTGLNQLSEAVRVLRSANARVLGIVLNDPPSRKQRDKGRSSIKTPI